MLYIGTHIKIKDNSGAQLGGLIKILQKLDNSSARIGGANKFYKKNTRIGNVLNCGKTIRNDINGLPKYEKKR